MNRFMLLPLAAALAGCTDPGEVRPATVLWMEWPATVAVDQPFQVRVVVPPLCDNGRFDVRHLRNDSIVAFETRWTDVKPSTWGCEPAGPIYDFSTLAGPRIPGPPRTLELRATSRDSLRHFGSVTLVAAPAPDSTLAAGQARFWSQTSSCHRLVPAGPSPQSPHSLPSYQLADLPPDTSSFRRFWVEGYLERATTACRRSPGDTLVFHLTGQTAIN